MTFLNTTKKTSEKVKKEALLEKERACANSSEKMSILTVEVNAVFLLARWVALPLLFLRGLLD